MYVQCTLYMYNVHCTCMYHSLIKKGPMSIAPYCTLGLVRVGGGPTLERGVGSLSQDFTYLLPFSLLHANTSCTCTIHCTCSRCYWKDFSCSSHCWQLACIMLCQTQRLYGMTVLLQVDTSNGRISWIVWTSEHTCVIVSMVNLRCSFM